MIHRLAVTLCMLLVITLCLAGGISQVEAAGQPLYQVLKHEIQVVLTGDGRATVTETIRYHLDADLRDLSFRLMADDLASVKLTRIGVANAITRLDQAIFVEAVPAEKKDTSVKPMTYHLVGHDTYWQVDLHVFLKTGAERSVSLTYEVDGAVRRHQDAAAYRAILFAHGTAADVHEPVLTIVMPRAIPAAQTWCLASSLTPFVMSQPSDSHLMFTAAAMDQKHPLDLTCLFPLDLFPTAPVAAVSSSWESLAAQARQRDQLLRKTQEQRSKALGFVFSMIALAALLGWSIYWFYDREGAVPDRQRYLRELPHIESPAVLALLLRKQKPAQIMLAMLLDLVRRQELVMDGALLTWSKSERSPDDLLDSERFLLHWLFGSAEKNHTVSIAQIRSMARDEQASAVFNQQYKHFRDLLSQEPAKAGLVDAVRTRKGKIATILVAIGYMMLSILVILLFQTWTGLLLLLPTAVFLIYSHTIRRLTNRGREIYAEGQALARYIRCMSRLAQPPDQSLQQDFVAYAMALGLISVYLSQLHALWAHKPYHDQLHLFGILRKNSQPVREQLANLSASLRVMESMLSASLLLADRVHL